MAYWFQKVHSVDFACSRWPRNCLWKSWSLLSFTHVWFWLLDFFLFIFLICQFLSQIYRVQSETMSHKNNSLKEICLTFVPWSMARFKTWKIPEGLYLSWSVEDSNSHNISDTHWNACLRSCSWSSLMRQALCCQTPITYKSHKTQKGKKLKK